jgi:hypothetical protein
MAKVGRAAYDASRRRLEKITATSKTLTLAESGEIYAVALAANCTITLPSAPENGTNYTFIITSQAGDDELILTSGSNARYFLGGVVHLDTTADENVVSVAGNGSTNSKLTMNDPLPGTRIECVSDGTLWYLSGGVVSATVPGFADQ